MAQLGIIVSYKTVRLWINKFGPEYSDFLKYKRNGFDDTFYIDEVFIKINSLQYYLWRAVDQDGDVIDVFFQQRIDVQVAKYFFKRLVTNIQSNSRKIVVDKLGSYRVAHRELMPTVSHDTSKYKNNRAELSHQPTRVRERGMLKFKSIMQANWFLS